MIFSIGIGYDRFLEGFCDMHLIKDDTVSIAKLEEIIEFCNDTLLFPGAFDATDTMRALADIIGPGNTVELDLNLQHYGTKRFGEGAKDPVLAFTRWDSKWPENTMKYNTASHPMELWAFLFDPLGLQFSIGIAKKNHSGIHTIWNVNIPFDTVDQLDYPKMIQLLETEFQFGANGVNIWEIIPKLHSITGGIVRRDPHGSSEFEKDMAHIDLVFLRQRGEDRCGITYHGDVEELKQFLTA
jgi:hypothetical protein